MSRAPTEAPAVRIRDVLLIPWSDADGDDQAFPPIGDQPVELGRDLLVRRPESGEAELIVNASLSRGHYFFPAWQDPFLYAFERELDPDAYGDRFSWDTDGTIKVALQLSRFVVDNGYSTEFAARIVDHEDGQQQVVPHLIHLLRFMPTYRLRQDRDWLTADEAVQLRDLIAAYWLHMDELPIRVARALSIAEGVVHTGVLERALVLPMMWIEALLNTNRDKVAKQITTRMRLVAAEVGIEGVTTTFARRMYGDRSKPAHGQELRLASATANPQEGEEPEAEINEDYLMKVALLEDLLRATVRLAIEDPEFAQIFSSDETICQRWPVIVAGASY